MTTDAPNVVTENSRRFNGRASIVLVGIRGAGKRSLAFIAATHLGWRFISEAFYFQQVTGVSKAQFLQTHGIDAFSQRSLAILRQMLRENAMECIIECGMATLAPAAQTMLLEYAQSHPVIHVTRETEHIIKLLGLSQDDARRLVEADRSHGMCTNYDYYNVYDPGSDAHTDVEADESSPSRSFALRNAQVNFCGYVDFILGRKQAGDNGPFSLPAVALELRPRTYVRSIFLSGLLQRGSMLEWNESGEDAVELVIDVYGNELMPQVNKYMALLKCVTGLPIIYSVSAEALDRDRDFASSYFNILDHGLRQAADYLSVELESPNAALQTIVQSKGQTKIIAHHHFKNARSLDWMHPARMAMFQKAKTLGFDIVRLTQYAVSRQDNRGVQRFRDAVSDLGLTTPLLIAYNVGELGKTSVICNQILTPVCGTHASFTSHGHLPTELTVREVTTALFRCFELDPLQFYVVGENTGYSRGPQMHTAAYLLYGLEHSFTSRILATFEEAISLWHQPNFGGSAISFPYKEQAYLACKMTSKHATAIGSVNTVIPLRLGTSISDEAAERNRGGPVGALYGDNSDWYGIYSNIKRKLSPRNAAHISKTTGLVLGAGGSARSAIYALIQVGCRTIVVLNRTLAKAERLASHFNTWARDALFVSTPPVQVLQPEQTTWPEGLDLPTMVVACIPTSDDAQRLALPPAWLSNPSGGVVADVSWPNSLFPLY